MLLTVPSDNSRGKQIAAADACMKGSHISWGWGKQHRSEWRSFHLFPSQRAQAGAESTGLLPEDWRSVCVSPGGVGITVPSFFMVLFCLFF